MAAPPAHSLDRGPHAEIRLGRGLTAQVAASLCRAVAAHVHAGVAVLELHMPEVERIDSVGLAALHQVGAFTAERGVILTLVPSPALHRALLDAQLLDEFTLAAPRAGEPWTTRRRLPEQLHAGREVADVVGDAHGGDQRRRAEDAAHLAGRGQEQRARDEDADEDGQAAEQRRALLGQPALLHRTHAVRSRSGSSSAW